MSKRQLWVKFWILFFPLNFRTEWACHSFTVVRIVWFCWNWFAPVQFQTIASISLQSELMKISFWESKKKTNQHWYLLSSNAKDELLQVFFFVFSQSLLIWEKKSTYNGNQVKKRNHAMTTNLFNVILPEKDQWHILTFGPKTERVSRCWSLMWKKSPQKYWHITNPKLQHFFVLMWKMMDIVASRKCWILVQRLWKCLNSLLESIYF